LIGASVRAAAQSAKRAKYDVLGIDRFGDSDTRAACAGFLPLAELEQMQPQEIIQLLSGANRSVPMMIVGDFFRPDTQSHGDDNRLNAALQVIHDHTQRVGASPIAAQGLKDPELLARIAIRARTQFPAYRLCEPDASGKASNLQADLPGRWLEKSTNSCGGLGVRWANRGSMGNRKIRGTQSDGILQRWHRGRSHGASFLSDGEQAVLLGICRSLSTSINKTPYVYAGSYGPVRVAEIVSSQLHAIGDQVVQQTGITGLFNADVLVDSEQKVTLLEINPRWSASMECVERTLVASSQSRVSPPESLIAWAVSATRDGTLGVKQRRIDSMIYDGPRFLKHIVYAKQSGSLDRNTLDAIKTGKGSGFDKVEFCDVPVDGTAVEKHEPLTSVICRQNIRTRLDWRKTKRLIASVQAAIVSSSV
jgi:predicted ATP-grasp superfamily ATP-dependent carboligase